MSIHQQRALRILSISTLVALGGAALSLLLALAVPSYGTCSTSFCLRIPTQLFFVGLLTPVALLLAIATDILGLIVSQRAQRSRWFSIFFVLLAFLVLGSISFIYLAYSVGARWQADVWWLLSGGFALMLGLTAMCALAYSAKAIALSGTRAQ
jgi:uncharacterized YccA/Bax inhibitor family protein